MDTVKKLHLGDKAVPLIIAFIAVVVVGVIAIKYYNNRDIVSSQRTACMIYVEGPCTVMREGATINATSEMQLYSGDTIYTGIGASARIRLDNDKFLYLDATTRINLTATGTPENSHTLVYVEAGSMLTEVKETLADGSTFDIVTPNTSTAIHGTEVVTQVEITVDGTTVTNIGFADGIGTYSVIERAADGTVCKTENTIQAGQSIGISTSALNLLLGADTKSVVLTGRTADGTAVRSVTLAELGTVLSESNFNMDFIQTVKEILEQSHQEDNSNANGSINNINTFTAGGDNTLPEGAKDAMQAASGDDTNPSPTEEGQTQNDEPTPTPTDDDSDADAGPSQPATGGNQQPAATTTPDAVVQIPPQTPEDPDAAAAAAAAAAQQNQNQNQGGGGSGGGGNSGGGGSSSGPSTPPSPSQGNTSDEHPHGEDIVVEDPGSTDPSNTDPSNTDTPSSASTDPDPNTGDDPGQGGGAQPDVPNPTDSNGSGTVTPSDSGYAVTPGD